MSNKSSIQSLIGAVLLMAAAVFYVFFLSDVMVDKDNLALDLKQKNAEYEQLRDELSSLEELAQEFDLSSEVYVRDAISKVPEGINQDEVIGSVVEMSEENGIELKSIGFSQGVTEIEDVGSLRINAGFQGDYQDLINFLESLESSRRLFVVDSINVSITKLNVTGLEVANFALSLETYYLL